MRHFIFLFTTMLILSSGMYSQQKKELWNSSQLLEPKILADRINQNETNNLLILAVGPDAIIKGSVYIGPTAEKKNLKKLKKYLKNIPKDKEVVIYCGCCPFTKCPNIRPAFKVLIDMGFKNAKLLNLSKNIKTNWLDKEYPIND